jgi:hypothetical protein
MCCLGDTSVASRFKARLCRDRPGYVLTNLTKVILDANTELRDTWTNMTPMVSFCVGFGMGTVDHFTWFGNRVAWYVTDTRAVERHGTNMVTT